MLITSPQEKDLLAIDDVEKYGITAANFANIAMRAVVQEDEYTASLASLLDAYPTHFLAIRNQEQAEAGKVVRRDVDAIMGASCPLTVNEVGRVFAEFIRDESGVRIQNAGCNPIQRAAALTLLRCIEEYPQPKVI